METNKLSEIASGFRSVLTGERLKTADPTLLNSEIEKQVREYFAKHENKVYEGYVLEKDFKEKETKIQELEKTIKENEASIKTYEETATKNKIGLLVGKVAAQTEEIVVNKYGDEIEPDGSNIAKIVEKAHKELPFTKTSKIDNFGQAKEIIEEKVEQTAEDKAELEKIKEEWSKDEDDLLEEQLNTNKNKGE